MQRNHWNVSAITKNNGVETLGESHITKLIGALKIDMKNNDVKKFVFKYTVMYIMYSICFILLNNGLAPRILRLLCKLES